MFNIVKKVAKVAKKAKKPPVDPEVKRRIRLAKFIVEKYVTKHEINWPRDVKMANKMVELYPEDQFWESLPVKFQSPTLACLMMPKAQEYLRRTWMEFKLVIPTPTVYDYKEPKQGDDYIAPQTLRVSLIDFSKKYGKDPETQS